mmetsp:Transcript_85168/g.190341  ORF Transcript_85168/g.190341 Transcript_85168/m.190341 type:complete len:269 (-) Transcript_85168:104-910(-)
MEHLGESGRGHGWLAGGPASGGLPNIVVLVGGASGLVACEAPEAPAVLDKPARPQLELAPSPSEVRPRVIDLHVEHQDIGTMIHVPTIHGVEGAAELRLLGLRAVVGPVDFLLGEDQVIPHHPHCEVFTLLLGRLEEHLQNVQQPLARQLVGVRVPLRPPRVGKHQNRKAVTAASLDLDQVVLRDDRALRDLLLTRQGDACLDAVDQEGEVNEPEIVHEGLELGPLEELPVLLHLRRDFDRRFPHVLPLLVDLLVAATGLRCLRRCHG